MSEPTTTSPTKENQPLNIEKMIRLHVYPHDDHFRIESEGMQNLGKPEFFFVVKEGIWVATACRIMNDVARYVVERNKYVKTGQRLQLGPWTVVEFRKWSNGGHPTIEIMNAYQEH